MAKNKVYLEVPFSSSSGPYYNSYNFSFSVNSSIGVQFDYMYTWGTPLPSSEERRIKLTGSGIYY